MNNIFHTAFESAKLQKLLKYSTVSAAEEHNETGGIWVMWAVQLRKHTVFITTSCIQRLSLRAQTLQIMSTLTHGHGGSIR